MSHPTRVVNLLRRLGPLARQAAADAELLGQVRSLLPSPLAEHIRGAHAVDGVLTVHVDSPTWATRIRFMAATLVTRITPPLRSCRVRVMSGAPPAAATSHGVKSARSLGTTVPTAAGDSPNLDAALRRLAATLARR